jgi:hypothetical protein
MDLRARPEVRPPDTRCPFCHDLLAVDVVQIECGGCGTRHHAACGIGVFMVVFALFIAWVTSR